MKTLYVTDLDGTLLRSNEQTSEFTNKTINELVEKGMMFSYATARSYVTARKVTKGLDARFPIIVHNGTFILDNATNELLLSNYFDSSIYSVLEELFEAGIYPIVYAMMDSRENFSFIEEKSSAAVLDFLSMRTDDPRRRQVYDEKALTAGDIYYLTCIDEEDKLRPFYEKYKDKYYCVFQRDIYSGEQWLEFMPPTASKSAAALQLKKLLGCDKLVVFGDGMNDIDMFQAADECYAVANAVEPLKSIATDIIGSNNEDSVARWLLENYDKDEYK